MTVGHEDELPSDMSNSFFDDWPLVWNDFKAAVSICGTAQASNLTSGLQDLLRGGLPAVQPLQVPLKRIPEEAHRSLFPSLLATTLQQFPPQTQHTFVLRQQSLPSTPAELLGRLHQCLCE